MANVPKHPRVDINTAKAGTGPEYVIIEGAPRHYISGYGVAEAGDIVTLPEGCNPGKWLQPVNPKDVAKVQGDEEAAAKAKAEGKK